uniref:Uncharacterized protein n=1 Tax=viral metagenome TaxID=1070528 RepID=A0A6C0CAC0_9ZZZZ
MNKSLTITFRKTDNDEIINSLIFTKIKKFKRLGTLHIKRSVNMFAGDFRRTDFGEGIYILFKIDGCILLSKDQITKDDVKKIKFKFYDQVCVGEDHMMGFFDDKIFDKIVADHDYFPDLVDNKKAGKLYEADFEDLKVGTEKIGYMISTKCGTAFPPLVCMRDDRNLIILGSKLMTKIYR